MIAEIETQAFLAAQMQAIVSDLSSALDNCAPERYTLPLPLLSGASIGEHTRHVVEFFQCVSNAFETEEVDYALRARNRKIETDKDFALQILNDVTVLLDMPNKPMQLCLGKQDGVMVMVDSNLYREIAYNIEHAIHHMAIIKIGLKSLQIQVKEDFGVAPSTLQHRAACAS
jgi:hypothetical protein